MTTLRCTAKYRRSFHLPETLPEPGAPQLILGEWYANTLTIERQKYLHYMSGRALLSVVIWHREGKTAEKRLLSALRDLLRHLHVPTSAIDAELSQMASFEYARASNRSVQASMRDQAFLAKYAILGRRAESPWDLSLRLAQTPCGPLGYRSPDQLVPELFAAGAIVPVGGA